LLNSNKRKEKKTVMAARIGHEKHNTDAALPDQVSPQLDLKKSGRGSFAVTIHIVLLCITKLQLFFYFHNQQNL
jgi:hypothetical protein